MPNLPRPVIVVAGVAVAVLVNLLVFAGGRVAGGTFRFTSPSGPAEVDAVTVAGFSAVPLLVGLTLVALLARVGWVAQAALFGGPVLAVVTIPLMTLPADFDGVSKAALALCHLTLVPIMVVAIRAMRPSLQTVA